MNTIKVDSSITPVIHPPRDVPVSLKDKIKDELDHTEKQGVVVKQKDPIDWENSMIAVKKPNNIRMCLPQGFE